MTLNKPTVVVDAGPFMRLETEPQYFSYFRQLFVQVLIPHEVAEELVRKRAQSPQDYLAFYGVQDMVQIVSPIFLEPFVVTHKPPLDRGEAEVISLAFQRQLVAVIEEKRGRNFANRHGVMAVNMAAFAVRGFIQGSLTQQQAEEMVNTMYRVHMFGDKLYNAFLGDIITAANQKGKPS